VIVLKKLPARRPFATLVLLYELPFCPGSLGGHMKRTLTIAISFCLLSAVAGCSSGGLTTREKGAGIGALGGAAVGGIIGAAVGRPGAGAAIGGALGLGSGALVGDQLQGQEQTQSEQQRQIDANQAELERQRRDLERLKKTGEY
jgi:uncharacterized protein YqgC (DUF456 family)